MAIRVKRLVAGVVLTAATVLAVTAAYQVGRESQTAEDKTIPDSRSFFVWGEAPQRYVSVQGSWEIDGPEKTAFQKELVSYTCQEGEPECAGALATVYKNGLSLRTFSSSAEWTGRQIVLSEGGGADCRVTAIVIDLTTQGVTSITTDGPNRPAKCTLPSLTKPRTARLVDGFERYFDQRYPNREHH